MKHTETVKAVRAALTDSPMQEDGDTDGGCFDPCFIPRAAEEGLPTRFGSLFTSNGDADKLNSKSGFSFANSSSGFIT